MAGASVVGASASVAEAEVVQITQANSQFNLPQIFEGPVEVSNTLSFDPSGDGIDDFNALALGINNGVMGYWLSMKDFYQGTQRTFFFIGYVDALNSYRLYVDDGQTGGPVYSTNFSSPPEACALIPIRFSDARFNGGAETQGFVEIKGKSTSKTVHNITLTRLIFDNADTNQPMVDKNTVYPEAISTGDPNAALRASITRKLKREQRKLRRARQAGNSNKLKKIRNKIRKFRKQLRGL